MEITLCCSEMVATGTSQPSHYLLRLLIILNQETERQEPLISGDCDSSATLTSVSTSLNTLLYIFSPASSSTANAVVNEIHPWEIGIRIIELLCFHHFCPSSVLCFSTSSEIKIISTLFSLFCPSMVRCKDKSVL